MIYVARTVYNTNCITHLQSTTRSGRFVQIYFTLYFRLLSLSIAYGISKSVVSFLAYSSYCGGVYIWVAFHDLEKTADALNFGISVLRRRD